MKVEKILNDAKFGRNARTVLGRKVSRSELAEAMERLPNTEAGKKIIAACGLREVRELVLSAMEAGRAIAAYSALEME